MEQENSKIDNFEIRNGHHAWIDSTTGKFYVERNDKNMAKKGENDKKNERELQKVQKEQSDCNEMVHNIKKPNVAGEIDNVLHKQTDYKDISKNLESPKRHNGKLYVKLDVQKYEQSQNKDKPNRITDEERKVENEYVEEVDYVKQEQSSYDDVSNYPEDDEMSGSGKFTEKLADIERKQMTYENRSDFMTTDAGKELEGDNRIELEIVEEEQTKYKDKSKVSEKSEAGNNTGKDLSAFEEKSSHTDSMRMVLSDTTDKVPYEYALRILSKYCIRYLDSPKTSKLYIFNGMIWEPLRDADDMASIVYKEMSVEDKRTQENIEGFCRKVASFIKFECKERNESGKERFLETDFKAVENRIVFKNCVYDIKTGEIMLHDRHLPYYIGIDSDYMEEDMDTPMYDKLKFDATGGDKASMDMFDLMLGYLMIPNRSGKCYFVMADAKDSGKSIFGHFIESIYMGSRVKTIDLEHLSGRFSMADADCVTLLSGLEVSMDRLTLPVAAQIKRITGESKIRVEAKYKGEQDVPIRFKLILATNGAMLLPRNKSDNAFYRRTIIIPFIKSMPLNQIIADMPKYLQDEKPAILSKAARRIGSIVELDGGIHFPESGLSLEMKETWMGSFDYEGIFIKEKLKFTAREEDAIPKEDIYRLYQLGFEKVTGNNTNAAMLTKNELMQKIMESYPGVSAKKLRRGSMECVGEIKLRPCMTCLAWNESIV